MDAQQRITVNYLVDQFKALTRTEEALRKKLDRHNSSISRLSKEQFNQYAAATEEWLKQRDGS